MVYTFLSIRKGQLLRHAIPSVQQFAYTEVENSTDAAYHRRHGPAFAGSVDGVLDFWAATVSAPERLQARNRLGERPALRDLLRAVGVKATTPATLSARKPGARCATQASSLARQQPETADGTTFISLEDETSSAEVSQPTLASWGCNSARGWLLSVNPTVA